MDFEICYLINQQCICQYSGNILVFGGGSAGARGAMMHLDNLKE
jgi:hypothetical protein